MIWQILSREYDRWPPEDPSDVVQVDDVPEPCSLTGHSMTLLPDDRLLIFGGWDGYNVSSRLYFFSPESGCWSEILSEIEDEFFIGPRTEGEEWPAARAYHTASLFLKTSHSWQIVFYGGGDSLNVSGSVFQLSFDSTLRSEQTTDSRADLSSSESARMRYEARSKKGRAALSAPCMKWTFINFEDQNSENFHHPAMRPQDRMQHTCTVIGECSMLVLGGLGREGRRLSDLWELRIDSWEWREIRIRGWGPASGHSAVLWRSGVISMFFSREFTVRPSYLVLIRAKFSYVLGHECCTDAL